MSVVVKPKSTGRAHFLSSITQSLLVVAGVALATAYVVRAEEPSEAATILGAVVAVGAPTVAGVRWLWSEKGRTAGDELLDDRVAQLAQALSSQWAREAHARRLLAPAPVDLRWTLSGRPAASGIASALSPPPAGLAPRAIPGVPPPTADALVLPHSLGQLHELYAGLPSGRVVILGDQGTGKTSSLLLLLLAALRYREALPAEQRQSVPVPVIVMLSTWNPAAETIQDFVAEALIRDHAFLGASFGGGFEAARELVERGQVALLLDGFDEMPAPTRVAALQAVDQLTELRIVISSRPPEYDEAVGHCPFHRSVVVEILPVATADAVGYLSQDHRASHDPGWGLVIDDLLGDGTGALAQALDSPLMLTLATDAYPPGSDPGGLTDRQRFPTAERIEEHLIDQMVRSGYTTAAGIPHAGRPRPAAERWLEYIAFRMPGTELVWSQVSEWVPARTARLFYSALFGLIAAASALLALDPSSVAAATPVVAGAWGLAGALSYFVAVGVDRRVTRMPVAGFSFGIAVGTFDGLAVGMAIGLALSSVTGDVLALAVGLAAGAALGITIGAALVIMGMQHPRLAARRSWPAALGAGVAARPTAFLLLFVIVDGLAVVLAVLFTPLSTSFAVMIAVAGVAIGVFGDVLMATQADPADLGSSSPEDSLRSDLAAWAVFGLPIGIGNALIFGFTFDNGIAGGLGWFALSFLIALASSHTGAFAFSVTTIALAGHGPLRLLRFLRDAHRRQVLRRAGWAYEFRHSRLQDRLAERYRDRPRS